MKDSSRVESANLAKSGIKRCSKCSGLKPFGDFYRKVSGYKSQCIACYRSAQKVYNATDGAKSKKREELARRRDADPEKFIRQRRSATLKHKYGITLEFYDSLIDSQSGRCAICLDVAVDTVLVVDHCHITGKIRGLLCKQCNSGIGMLRDDAEVVARALQYLTECPVG